MISKLEKTKKRIPSKKKKAKEYSLAWFVNDLFQHIKIQTGTKKAVKMIIIKAKPSIPSTMLTLIELNQLTLSTNWNCADELSKKKSKPTEALSISNDQNKEKLRIKLIFVLSVNSKTKHPKKGKEAKRNNIYNK